MVNTLDTNVKNSSKINQYGKRAYKRLSEDEKDFLRANYLLLTDKQLGVILDRKPDTIRKHRQILGLSRKRKDLQKVLAEVPIVIWMPRGLFGTKEIDLEKLKIQENT